MIYLSLIFPLLFISPPHLTVADTNIDRHPFSSPKSSQLLLSTGHNVSREFCRMDQVGPLTLDPSYLYTLDSLYKNPVCLIRSSALDTQPFLGRRASSYFFQNLQREPRSLGEKLAFSSRRVAVAKPSTIRSDATLSCIHFGFVVFLGAAVFFFQ
ncbi:uncharacterized protein VTP21DRAFT_335 [Calcarisporiella thermophila]|uniref:uncharacterized protein n=1 Tax=Calcarisporiella thermophila TaxID=911321 RepID=UPI00374238B5